VLIHGDARHIPLKDRSVQCVCTSPPYWAQRDYEIDGQIGLEPTPDDYVAKIVSVFREVRRVLRDDGVCWIVLGDSYSHSGSAHRDPARWPKQAAARHMVGRIKERTGAKPKDLLMIPARAAIALRDDGWRLRSDIIWQKPTPFPEAVRDRPKRSFEHIFLLAKSKRYFYDADAVDMKRDVWTIASDRRHDGDFFAAFPKKLAELCVLAGSRTGDLVFDPFLGSGTTGFVAEQLGRRWIGLDLNRDYVVQVQRSVVPTLADLCEDLSSVENLHSAASALMRRSASYRSCVASERQDRNTDDDHKAPNRRKPKKLPGAALADQHRRMRAKFFTKKT
jgi:site-specific DNA-methyltransferase (cytosine-N4-specific)